MSTAIWLRVLLFGAAIGASSFATPASAQATSAQVKPDQGIPVPEPAPYVRNPLPDDPRLKTNQFDVMYVEPKNPAHIPIYERLKSKHVLEKLQEFLAPLRLPIRITIKTEGCDGVTNAYFDNATIKVCYEYFEYLMKKSPKMVRQGLTPNDALIGPTVDVFLHELGHGLVRVLDVPYFGKEEDVADYIATYLLLKFCKDDARRLILGASFIGDAEAMEEQGRAPELRTLADSHSLPAQRYFNRWCMAYGADQETFADAIELGMLPPNRVKWCKYEWQSNEYAFQQLIEPYVDHEMKQKVMAKHWFTFESPVSATMVKPRQQQVAQPVPVKDGDPSKPAASTDGEAQPARSAR
jgi:hypothetical protein